MASVLDQNFNFGMTDEERKRRLAQQQQVGQVVQPGVAPTAPAAPVYDPSAARAASDSKTAALDQQSTDLFNSYRQKAQQAGQVNKQTQGEALQRRFAQIGNLNSGAYIKAAGLQDAAADKATDQSVQDVNLQEQQQKVASNESEKNRIFQREQQDLQSSQFDKQFGLQLDQFKQSQASDRLNALTAVSGLNDEALKAQSGIQDFQGGFLGTGNNSGKVSAIQKILAQYGYA